MLSRVSLSSLRYIANRSLTSLCGSWPSHLQWCVNSRYKISECSRTLIDGRTNSGLVGFLWSASCTFTVWRRFLEARAHFSSLLLQLLIRSIMNFRRSGCFSSRRMSRLSSSVSNALRCSWAVWSCCRKYTNFANLLLFVPWLPLFSFDTDEGARIRVCQNVSRVVCKGARCKSVPQTYLCLAPGKTFKEI